MLTLILRLVLIYLFTLLASRCMGKRQIGQLQLSELVSAFFLSELATYCVTDPNIPLLFALIPIACVILLEILISFLSTRFPLVRKAIDDPPSYLIAKGKLKPEEMDKNRVTQGELMSQIRQKGIGDLHDVYYAVLESNGTISVIPKADRQSLTPEDMKLAIKEKGLSHALIVNGKIDYPTLNALNKNKDWLKGIMKKQKIKDLRSVYLLTVTDDGEIYCHKNQAP